MRGDDPQGSTLPRAAVLAILAAIMLAGLALRLVALDRDGLEPFDEAYHAVVARNLAEDPLRPLLYRDPALPYDPHSWTGGHVWLHKPPLSLWLMAGAIRGFGPTPRVVRIPSLVIGTVVVLTRETIGLGSRRGCRDGFEFGQQGREQVGKLPAFEE